MTRIAFRRAGVALVLAGLAGTGLSASPASAATIGLGGSILSGTAGSGVAGLISSLTSVPTLGDTVWGDDDTHQGASASASGVWNAAADQGSMFSLAKSIGAQSVWRTGDTGAGVTVALIDTGVAPVPGLDADGKVLYGPDLSYESQRDGTRYYDGYGHGTHLAGIIAGRDAGFDPRRPDPGMFAGVAPDAQLLSVKVATGDGGADVTQVIAALDWVVEHRRDNGMDVRVINLSYGTSSTQSWQVDPLAAAVENAYRKGILVVTSAGNDGAGHALLMPAIDPYALAVGASDNEGTAATYDDQVADFSSSGDRSRRPDLLAPGKSVVSLRVPGSFVDQLHPEGLVPGDTAQRFFRGSGTSQSAAVTSGAAALLFSARPSLTPSQAKGILMQTARPLATLDPSQGSGVVDVARAVDLARTGLFLPSAPTPSQKSTGLGPLEATRGGEHVVDPDTGTALTGQVDALGSPWDAQSWMAADAAGTSWVGGAWNGRTWTGNSWNGSQWAPATWTGNSWTGRPWSDYIFSDDQWEARSWRGGSWKARSWREASWKARSWRDLS